MEILTNLARVTLKILYSTGEPQSAKGLRHWQCAFAITMFGYIYHGSFPYISVFNGANTIVRSTRTANILGLLYRDSIINVLGKHSLPIFQS